ncbi:MAG: histidine kinase dimerization/phospho-acceptor domain-containing protein [Myxococcota bacterium]|nr:histidine kinase dimerization/phospho-acceptor domain-containing protein [Myxococcota bacterium]
MTSLWIVHREEALRRALARLAGAGEDAVIGGPGEPLFDQAPAPRVVLLGLAGDLESELEFVHRCGRRFGEVSWILLGEPWDLERARRLFDNLPAAFLEYPPEASVLRGAVGAAAARRDGDPLPLSQRPARDALSERFGRAFSDLELPELLRALDPRLAEVPVLVLGEPGTGRGTLVRYLHHFGGTAGGALIELACGPETSSADLLAALAASRHNPRSLRACSLWLVDVDRMSAPLQRQVAGWVEFGPAEEAIRSGLVRWIASGQERNLEPELRQALSGITLRVPPLRERPELIANLANGTARAWCSSRGVAVRRLGEDALAVLEEYPWPGNLRELEAVVEQSLAASSADPVGVEDLVLDGAAFAPVGGPALAEPPPGEPRDVAPAAPLEAAGPLATEPPAPIFAPSAPLPPEAPFTPEEPLVQAIAELPGAAGELPVEEAEYVLESLELLEDDEEADLDDEGPFEPEPEAGLLGGDELEEDGLPAAPPAPPQPAPEAPGATSRRELDRLVSALAQEVRNPLTSIRGLAEALPDRDADEEFRGRLAALTTESVMRIEGALERLERLTSFAPPEPADVDVCALLEEVLDKRRGRIHERRLLVLEELDRGRPRAHCDPEQLRFALEAVLDAALQLVPERGHVYLASKRNAVGLRGGPSVRVLLRYRGPQLGGPAPERSDLAAAGNSLDVAVAEIVIRAQRGTLTVDASDRSETLLIIDLPS